MTPEFIILSEFWQSCLLDHVPQPHPTTLEPGNLMPAIKSVCVYCGSSFGADLRYREIARELGEALAANGIDLVFGGGRVGLMGTIADAVLAAGGRATGIMPESLRNAELAHTGLTELV